MIVGGRPGVEKAWLVVERRCRVGEDHGEGGVGASEGAHRFVPVEAMATVSIMVSLTELPRRHLADVASAR